MDTISLDAAFADAPTVRDVLDLAAVMPLGQDGSGRSDHADRWHRHRAFEVLEAVFVPGCALDPSRTRLTVLTTRDEGPSILLRSDGRADVMIACYEPSEDSGHRLYNFGYRHAGSGKTWLWGDQIRFKRLADEAQNGSIFERLSRAAA